MRSLVLTGNYRVYILGASFSGQGESPASLFSTPSNPMTGIDLLFPFSLERTSGEAGALPLASDGARGGQGVLR